MRRMLATAHPAKRLAVFMAASLGAHLVLMSAIQSPRPFTLPVDSDSVLQWVDLPTPPIKANPSSAATAPTRTASTHSPSTEENLPPVPMPTDPASPPARADAPQHPPSTLDTTSLTSAARAIARDMALTDKNPPDAYTLPENRPILPQLAQALQRETAGERYLGNGVTRIVTSRGQVLCFNTPPDFARGGPVEMHSMQVSCPR